MAWLAARPALRSSIGPRQVGRHERSLWAWSDRKVSAYASWTPLSRGIQLPLRLSTRDSARGMRGAYRSFVPSDPARRASGWKSGLARPRRVRLTQRVTQPHFLARHIAHHQPGPSVNGPADRSPACQTSVRSLARPIDHALAFERASPKPTNPTRRPHRHGFHPPETSEKSAFDWQGPHCP